VSFPDGWHSRPCRSVSRWSTTMAFRAGHGPRRAEQAVPANPDHADRGLLTLITTAGASWPTRLRTRVAPVYRRGPALDTRARGCSARARSCGRATQQHRALERGERAHQHLFGRHVEWWWARRPPGIRRIVELSARTGVLLPPTARDSFSCCPEKPNAPASRATSDDASETHSARFEDGFLALAAPSSARK